MSSLWTPGGEHQVPRPSSTTQRGQSGGGAPPRAPTVSEPPGVAGTEHEFDDLDDLDRGDHDDDVIDLGDDEAAIMAELAEVRRQLASVPAAQVIANHAMGLFELAAIHLGQPTPNFAEASVAIDAMAAVVERVGDRLEPHRATLVEALAQIRMAFVQLKGAAAPA